MTYFHVDDKGEVSFIGKLPTEANRKLLMRFNDDISVRMSLLKAVHAIHVIVRTHKHHVSKMFNLENETYERDIRTFINQTLLSGE